MEKLNLIKILKDCPKRTKFYSPVYGKIEFIRIEAFENNPDPIVIKWFKDENTAFFEYLRADGTFRGLGECIIFPSEEQRDWSKWQRPFVKGDILVSEAGNIVLCSHIDENQLVHYHCLLNFLDILKIRNDVGVGYSYECTLANDSQKQKLLDALKKEGYEWDVDKKELKTLQPFKDGDIIYNKIQKRICICHYRKDEKLCVSHCRYNVYHKEFELLDKDLVIVKQDYRIATDEEKQILFDAIKENGYNWNPVTKTLEKLIEPKFKIGDKIKHKDDEIVITITGIKNDYYFMQYYNKKRHDYQNEKISFKYQNEYELVLNKFDPKTLQPFDKVLVRDDNTSMWINAFYGFYDTVTTKKYPFVANAVNWTQCIPYEGNEHLLGTDDDCDEYYKNW